MKPDNELVNDVPELNHEPELDPEDEDPKNELPAATAAPPTSGLFEYVINRRIIMPIIARNPKKNDVNNSAGLEAG